ncbi:MAG: hypothetical protein KDD53_07720, partial [Bdellovibrionales bacterium]|nr:hypothetical protein [Bdellovibrionales bacterium]
MAHIEQKPTAPVPSGIPDERTIQAVMRQTLLSREDVLIYLSGLNDDDSLALELSRLTATQTIEDTRQEIQTASISADAIAYAWGDSLHAPSVETFERLSEKFPKADVIVILLYALSESPFYAIDAGPLDRSGKSLLLDTQIEKLTSTRDTFKFALIHEFARYFALGHNYDCSTFDDLREELRDEDDGDEAAIQIPRPERDLFGDLALDEVALSGASIQEALLEVRALFPDVLMQLALETVLNHAKQMGTRSLLSTLRSLDNLLEKDPTTLQRLIAASGGLTEPHYAATDSVEDTEDEDLAVASSKPAPCTPDIVYADPRGDFGDLSYGPIDLLVAIEAQLTNQALICAKNSGVLPRYHGSSPRNLYEDLPTLLRLGISPELVELVKSDPEIIARLIEINRESLNKLAANEKSSEWAEAARTFWEISADLRDERGEISIDRVRYLLESILPETSIAD